MKLKVDWENDTVYFRLDDASIVDSEEVQPGVILDYNAHRKVVGVEILGVSARVSPEKLKSLQFDTA